MEEPAAILSHFASRYAEVELQARQWDLNESHVCLLNIKRGDCIIQVDSKYPFIDITKLDIDFGGMKDVEGKRVIQHLKNRVSDAVDEALKGVKFTMHLVHTSPSVRFTLVGKGPSCLSIPAFFEGSWKSFLPDHSPEQVAYLAAVRLVSERQKPVPRDDIALQALQEALSIAQAA